MKKKQLPKVPLEIILCCVCLAPLARHELNLKAADGTGPYCEDCFPFDDSDEWDDDDEDDEDEEDSEDRDLLGY